MAFAEDSAMYIKLSHNGTNSLVYDYLRCENARHRILSTEISDLVLRFIVTRDFEVWTDRPIINVDKLFLLHPIKCTLSNLLVYHHQD
jgi:hypothetical protein